MGADSRFARATHSRRHGRRAVRPEGLLCANRTRTIGSPGAPYRGAMKATRSVLVRTASRWGAVLGLVLAGSLGACGSSKSGSPQTATSTQAAVKAKEVSPSGDIPDDQAYVSFVGPGGAFSVKVPEGWARSESGTVTTFTDKLNIVRVEARPGTGAPTTASAVRDEVPAIKASEAHVTVSGVSEVTRPAGLAVLIKYQADATPNSVTGKSSRLAVEHYEFWRAGQTVVLTLSGPVGSDNVDPWKMVTSSFVWKG